MLNQEFPSSKEWLMLLKHKQKLTSDYQLAKYLSMTQQAISKLMLGQCVMSDTTALKVADGVGMSHLLLILSVSRERLKSQQFNDELDKLPSDIFKASCYFLTGFLMASLCYIPSLMRVI